MMLSVNEMWEGRGERGRSVYLIRYSGRWGRHEWRIPRSRWRPIELDCDVCGSYQAKVSMVYRYGCWYCQECTPVTAPEREDGHVWE
jgi:hypothetical protein